MSTITDIRILGRTLQNMILVEVETSDGVVGIGGADTHGPAAAAIIEAGPRSLRRLLLGQDASDVVSLWQKMYQHWVAQGGPIINAMAAIDMALWDALGKAQGLPIAHLIGETVQPKVMAYASATAFRWTETPDGGEWHHKDATALALEAVRYQSQGFKAMKFGWGNYFNPEDLEKLAGVREAIGPEMRFMVDFGNPAFWSEAWDAHQAIRIAHLCEKYDIYFLEEPLQPYDMEGLAEVSAAVNLKIASGEMLTATHEFERLISMHGVDIIQPDAYRIGITQLVQVARIAERSGILVVPHSPWSALAIAAHLQVLSTIPNGDMIEYAGDGLYTDEGKQWGETVHITINELVEYPPIVEDGYLTLHSGPGLGLGQFIPEAVERLEAVNSEAAQP